MPARLLLVLLALLPGPLAGADITGLGSGLAMYKARRLAEVLPFRETSAAAVHQVMRRLAQLSLSPLFSVTLRSVDTELNPDWPRLELIDNDNDLRADFFVYHGAEGPSDLYGAMFPLTPGGPPAWVVFPVGPSIDENVEFVFLFNHWVDRNEDGAVDLVIFEDINRHGTGRVERDVSSWLADDDFDGLFERAAHCAPDGCAPITAEDGMFDLRRVLGPETEGRVRANAEWEGAAMINVLLSDLRRGMAGER